MSHRRSPESNMATSLLELSQVAVAVTKPVAKQILWPLDLEVGSGQSVAVVGPSGAGKTTLAAVLGGLLPPTTGSYVFAGRALHDLDTRALATFRRDEVGFVFQASNLVDERSAWRNVAIGLPQRNEPPGEARDRCVAALEQVGLADLADTKAAVLSGGERQRVAIARALVKQPRLLIADEPTGALDQANGDLVLDLLAATSETRGTALVLVTHDRRAADRTQRLVEMVDGRLNERPRGRAGWR